MGEQWFKSCLPEEYYEQFINEGIYPDGRSVSAFRSLYFKLGAWGGVGSALVKLGGVAVSCSVHASLALVHDGPLVSCEIDSYKIQAEISNINDMLMEVFANNSLTLRSALLVKGNDEGISMTWELIFRVQVGILNSDGSIPDAVFCAVSAALFDTRLPSILLTHSKDDEAPLRQEEISVLDELLVDPPHDLIEKCSAKVSFVTDGTNVLAMSIRGVLTEENLFSSMASVAARRHQVVMDAIRHHTSL
ncbi:unnamed protein product [Haemonchus placei]|uniref:Ribosomal RNA-processing protein 43 n=1 Tax=Haemonchus placei TaxID=6290 RepID=A0A0N4X753_HAEPC|nr:unnamed protein product [Haemonchus placei]